MIYQTNSVLKAHELFHTFTFSMSIEEALKSIHVVDTTANKRMRKKEL